MKKVIIPLAGGCEEMEVVIIADVLRRAGIDVTLAATGNATITASRGIKLTADCLWSAVNPAQYDAIIIPGGADGVERLRQHTALREALTESHAAGRLIAAICAGPQVLHAAGLLDGRKATCYPTLAEKLPTAHYQKETVVTDGNIITSRGPGTAFEFALTIAARLAGHDRAAQVRSALCME